MAKAIPTTTNSTEATWTLVRAKLTRLRERLGDGIPYIATNHRYTDVGDDHLDWWTNGFWIGMLWQLYGADHDLAVAKQATALEARLDPLLQDFTSLDHDVGFMWLNASVSGYRLCGDQQARQRGLKAALVLAGRYNPVGCFIKAWNGADQQGQLIIDCLMNLPLLHWASQETGDPRFDQIAQAHAQTALSTLFRSDGSVAHIAVMDPQSGEFLKTLGGQGYAQGSSWSRGQAWGIYGMALAYRDYGQPEFLDAAKRVAQYFISNVALSGWVSLIDFRAPAEPRYWDTSATAIAVCGLLALADQLPATEASGYRQAAVKMFDALTTRFADLDAEHDELLTKASAKYHRASDREVPIIYGDAFYLEALLRLRHKASQIY
ncbi:glycoside hydrolase family 88 protein [Lacticaseibacillus sp. GG6-2]